MNKQQQHLFQLLKEIHTICVNNNITYYLAMGSLIGAVRHGGFLPWDDDADILMTRDEFERFKKACEKDLPPNRMLCSSRTVESFGFLLPRYISTDATAIHRAQSIEPDACGEVIDIFLLDPLADGDEAYMNYLLDVNLYSDVINCANAAASRFNLSPELFDRYNKIREEQGVMAVSEQLEKRLERNFDANGKRYGFRWNGVTLAMERSWFENVRLVDFEGEQFMAPGGVHEFLTCYYGDEWTQIPNSIKPGKHNAASSIALPYKDALEFYEPAEDLAQLKADVYKRKRLVLENASEMNALKDEAARARATIAKLELENTLREKRPELDAAVAAGDGKTASKILADYLAVQLGMPFIGRNFHNGMARLIRPVLIDVEPAVFEAALLALMCTGRISKAHRMLEVWQQCSRQRSASMEHTAQLIERFRFACACFEQRKMVPGLEEAERLLQELPKADSFIKLRMVFLASMTEQDPTEDRLATLEDAVQSALKIDPEDGFFIKYAGDVARLRGDDAAARKLYLAAAEKTRNGYALRDIFERTGYHPSWYRLPAWAHKYGVEQWEGEDVPVPWHEVSQGAGDAKQKLLFSLLKEVCALCEENRIQYLLAPAVAKAFSEQNALPSKPEDYAIACEPEAALELARVLQREAAQSDGTRNLMFYGNNQDLKDCTLYYGDANSLLLKLDGSKPDPVGILAARVLVPQRVGSAPTPSFAQKLRSKLGLDKESDARLENYRLLLKKKSAVAGELSAGGDKSVRVDLGQLAQGAVKLEYCGFAFSVPTTLDAYIARAFSATGVALEVGAGYATSAQINLSQLAAAGGFSASYYERKAVYSKNTRFAREVSKRFKANFEALKLAVALKELSLELLPQKQRICALAEQGNVKELKSILDKYLTLANKHKGAPNLAFDEQIYAALGLLQTQKN